MKRKIIRKRSSKRLFRKTAGSKGVNFKPEPMRGGFRL